MTDGEHNNEEQYGVDPKWKKNFENLGFSINRLREEVDKADISLGESLASFVQRLSGLTYQQKKQFAEGFIDALTRAAYIGSESGNIVPHAQDEAAAIQARAQGSLYQGKFKISPAASRLLGLGAFAEKGLLAPPEDPPPTPQVSSTQSGTGQTQE